MTTRIAADKVLAVITNAELLVTEKAAWLRCEAAKDRRLYVPKGAKTIARIDLSGFEVPAGEEEEYGVKSLGGESFGSVKSQLSFEGTEEQILENLAKVIIFMRSLEGKVKVVRAPVETKSEAKAKAAKEPKMPHATKLARAAMIRAAADKE